MDLSNVRGVLAYLKGCGSLPGESAWPTTWDRTVYRISASSALAAGALVAVAVSLMLWWTHGVELSEGRRTVLSVMLMMMSFLIFISFICLLILVIRFVWIFPKQKSALDATIDADERHARPLLRCPEAVLAYAREWLRRLIDRRERRSSFVMKDGALVAIIGVSFAAWTGWATVWKAASGERFLGVNMEALQSAGNFTVGCAIVLLIVGTFRARFEVAKLNHQLEIVDIALALRMIEEGGGMTSPVDTDM